MFAYTVYVPTTLTFNKVSFGVPSPTYKNRCYKMTLQDFPDGAVDKNSPANVGDMGLTPGLGRFHMPWGN